MGVGAEGSESGRTAATRGATLQGGNAHPARQFTEQLDSASLRDGNLGGGRVAMEELNREARVSAEEKTDERGQQKGFGGCGPLGQTSQGAAEERGKERRGLRARELRTKRDLIHIVRPESHQGRKPPPQRGPPQLDAKTRASPSELRTRDQGAAVWDAG